MGGCVGGNEDKKNSRKDLDIKNHLTVATLNYCGIMNSPFEFYCEGFTLMLEELSAIFVELLPRYFTTFNKDKFKWEFGKLDVQFRIGRYSPMFTLTVGIDDNKFMSRTRFEEKWEEVFREMAIKMKVDVKRQEKDNLKLYDIITYHTFLRYVYKVKEIDDTVNLSPAKYLQVMKPFYELSFLDEKKKLTKFIESLTNIKADVFFFQEYSQYFFEYIQTQKEYYISVDKAKDNLIIARKSSFKVKADEKEILSKLSKEQFANLNWSGSSSFMCLDNIIMIGAHLSSNEVKNKEQIQQLIKGLTELRTMLPDFEVIVGGDLNSYLEPFAEQYHMYPAKPEELTTIKKRTMTQGQFHKGNKIVEDSKDKIISTLKIDDGKITYINGEPIKRDCHVPSDQHPFDHFVLFAQIFKPK